MTHPATIGPQDRIWLSIVVDNCADGQQRSHAAVTNKPLPLLAFNTAAKGHEG